MAVISGRVLADHFKQPELFRVHRAQPLTWVRRVDSVGSDTVEGQNTPGRADTWALGRRREAPRVPQAYHTRGEAVAARTTP